jgi:hypothetical protein
MSPPFDLEKAIDEATQKAIAETEKAYEIISVPLEKAKNAQLDGNRPESFQQYRKAFFQLLQSEIPSDYLNAMTYKVSVEGLSLYYCYTHFQYDLNIKVQWENLRLGVPWRIVVEKNQISDRRCQKGRLLENLLLVFGEIRALRGRTQYRVEESI